MKTMPELRRLIQAAALDYPLLTAKATTLPRIRLDGVFSVVSRHADEDDAALCYCSGDNGRAEADLIASALNAIPELLEWVTINDKRIDSLIAESAHKDELIHDLRRGQDATAANTIALQQQRITELQEEVFHWHRWHRGAPGAYQLPPTTSTPDTPK